MKYAITGLLSAIIGCRAGQYLTRRKIRRGIAAATAKFSASLTAALKDATDVIDGMKAKAQAVPADTLAREPLPVRPGDTDKALARGELAVFKEYGGSC